jgi:hypothetical protein
MFYTIEQIKRANERAGGCWFDPDAMRFFPPGSCAGFSPVGTGPCSSRRTGTPTAGAGGAGATVSAGWTLPAISAPWGNSGPGAPGPRRWQRRAGWPGKRTRRR